jgi:5-hydroxyisourate hydrolase
LAATPETARPTISTHVLDTERGLPAAGVHVTLSRIAEGDRPIRVTQALTDSDGRVRDLLERPLVAGDYRLEFRLGTDRDGKTDGDGGGDGSARGAFFRRLAVDLHITDTSRSYHVPLLLSSFGLTTYRGS